MNWMNGGFCNRAILRPNCHSNLFLFVSNKSFVTLVTRRLHCLFPYLF